jgi:hypothetical protein
LKERFRNQGVPEALFIPESPAVTLYAGRMLIDAAWFANDVAVIAAAVSGLALGISAMAAWYSRRQAIAAERQVKSAEEAVELQREAVKSEAQNTATALELASQNAYAVRLIAETAEKSRLARRAWLAPLSCAIDRDPATNLPRSAILTFKNTGATPALSITSWDAFVIMTPDNPLMLDDDDFNDQLELAQSVMGPDTTILARRQFMLGDQNGQASIREGLQILWWYGRLRYADINGDQHKLPWCYEYNVDQQRFDMSGSFPECT